MPSALTWIIASLHVAFGLAIIGAIVGEFLGAQKGLGLVIASVWVGDRLAAKVVGKKKKVQGIQAVAGTGPVFWMLSAMLAVSTDTVSGSVHTMTSQFELAEPVPGAPLQSGPAAETARIVAVASDDKQNFRTLGMMSSLKGARLIGAM